MNVIALDLLRSKGSQANQLEILIQPENMDLISIHVSPSEPIACSFPRVFQGTRPAPRRVLTPHTQSINHTDMLTSANGNMVGPKIIYRMRRSFLLLRVTIMARAAIGVGFLS